MPRLVLVLPFLLLASPALADDADTRFHDAYVREVIDGEIAEAAKAYLDLVSDEAVPAPIRAESRFRFAICTVLLGRPDEGRMQLAAIVENERTPKSLRQRAQAYLDAISTLGVGTELERKLQSLVFDLGRVSPYEHPIAAYRDFEIIGRPAIPFLEKLLVHEDANLRRHAFRLLIRLGADDLVSRWTPKIGFGRPGLNVDFVQRYLDRRPDEVRRLERTLLALDDEALRKQLDLLSPHPKWSLAFVRGLVARSVTRGHGFAYLDRSGTKEQRWAFARSTMLAEDEALANAACNWALNQGGGPPDDMVEALWAPALRYLKAYGEAGIRSGTIDAWVKRLPTEVLLSSVGEIVALGEGPLAKGARDPLRRGLAPVFSAPLTSRELTPDQLDAFEALVKRWVEAVAPRLEPKRPSHAASAAVPPLPELMRRLPPARGQALVRWLFEGPAYDRAAWFRGYLRIFRPEDVALLLEAAKAVDPAQAALLVQLLPRFTDKSPSVEVALAELEALPDLLRLTSASTMDGPTGYTGLWASMVELRGRVPDEVLKTTVRSLFEVALGKIEDEPKALFDRLVDFRTGSGSALRRRTTFFARFVLPSIKRYAEDLPVPFRRHVLRKALFVLNNRYPFEERDRERIAWFVLQGVDDLEKKDLPTLARHPDLFPLEHWIPWVEAAALRHPVVFERADVDRAMKVLTEDLAKINQAVLQVLVGYASPDVAKAVLDRMLASEDAKIRDQAIDTLPEHRRPGVSAVLATPEALEAALASLLAEEDPDRGRLAKVALLLSEVAPSERLFPAAERLLASDAKAHLFAGIRLASRLGREELLPALSRHLDSLDAGLRDRARKAIGAIREVKRFKEEAEAPR